MWDTATRQAIVQFRDGSWRLCRLIAWQQHDDGTWLCELRWGVSGRLYQARYVYDAAMVSRFSGLLHPRMSHTQHSRRCMIFHFPQVIRSCAAFDAQYVPNSEPAHLAVTGSQVGGSLGSG
jgi:hypothetical protein